MNMPHQGTGQSFRKEIFMRKNKWTAFLAISVLATGACFAAAAPACPPKTPKMPVVDSYHGVNITDNYRWLENWGDAKVKAWSEAQNACARAYLDTLSGREAIQTRLTELLGGATPSYFNAKIVGSSYFFMKYQPPKQQPVLITLDSPDNPAGARVILDPNVLDARGITAMDWYEPSPDGRLVAVSLSVGGSEDGTLHVYDTTTGKPVFETIARVQEGTGGGSLAWDQDGKGFYYTRYPRGKERSASDLDFYQQVYHHTLGTPEDKDVYCVGKTFPRIAETVLTRSDDGAHVLAQVANGDGGEFAFYLMDSAGRWARVADFQDGVKHMEFGPDGMLYLLSVKNAPRGRVLSMPLTDLNLGRAPVVVPPSEAVIEQIVPATSRLYVSEMVGGPFRIRAFGLPKGNPLGEVPVLPVAGVAGLHRIGKDDLLFGAESYLKPGGWYTYAAAGGATAPTALMETSPADFSDTDVVRTTAVSSDGTSIPLVIFMRKRTVLDGSHPTVLYGYGGYGVSEAPYFSPSRRVWIEQGGVYAIASLRGGGEFGEEWHKAGMLTHKQNVFDDFFACARFLVDQKYTRSDRLAIEGGSNGGLLMGAELTQHPAFFRAVVSSVGIYDMLRVELSSNGAYNVTEFGTVKDPVLFKALFAYSPYHNVQDKTPYPAVLFTTGANDPRVEPMQSRKMTARLQAATSSKYPVLLRTSSTTGHGIDTAFSERVAEETDVFAFLFHELGIDLQPAR